MNACFVNSCDRKHFGGGLCQMHYQRKRRTGNISEQKAARITIRRAPGTKSLSIDGYVLIAGAQKAEHITIAERALGTPLPINVVVHHIDEDRSHNANRNLLICTRAYHALIHLRMRAREACGNPSFRKCVICHQWCATSTMQAKGRSYRHKECHRLYEANRNTKGESK